jgi:hypothetical protein
MESPLAMHALISADTTYTPVLEHSRDGRSLSSFVKKALGLHANGYFQQDGGHDGG